MDFVGPVVIIAFAIAAGLGSRYFLGDDNPIEEASEDIIKKEIGLDIDLSPQSPEKKDGNPK